METGIRGDLEWGTTPGLVRSAAERFGDADALVDGDVRLTFAELATAVVDAGRAFIAAGLEPGDRVAIWSPNVWEWVVAVLGLQSAGGVVVPINTRYKGAEAAYLLDRSRARVLVTVNGFLGNDYVGMLDGHDLPHLEHTVVLRGDVPAGAQPRGRDFVAPVATRRPRRGGRPGGRPHPRRRVRHPLHQRHHREPQGCGVHPRPGRAGLRRLGGGRGAAARRPLPRDQPVLPRLRLQGRDHRLAHRRRHALPAERVRHPDRDGERRRAPDHDAPRAAGGVPDVPQPPRRRPRRSCSRCGSPSPAPPPCRSSWSSG